MATTDVAAVKEGSVCVILGTSRFRVRRSVGRDEVDISATGQGKKKPDKTMLVVGKDLLDCDELRAIVGHDGATKDWVRAHSCPSDLLRSSAYLVSVEALVEVYEYLEKRLLERAELIKKFRKAYPAAKASGKARLGPLFDEQDYPPPEAIERAFKLTWRVVEIGTPTDKLRTISKALFEKESAKAEEVWQNSVGLINEALIAGMSEVVKHFVDKMGGGDEKPKRLRQAAVDNVLGFLDTFDKRNLTRNADLSRLVGQAKGLLAGVDVKTIKSKDDVRKQIADGFAGIDKTLDKLMEDRPSRAISFDDEEV